MCDKERYEKVKKIVLEWAENESNHKDFKGFTFLDLHSMLPEKLEDYTYEDLRKVFRDLTKKGEIVQIGQNKKHDPIFDLRISLLS